MDETEHLIHSDFTREDLDGAKIEFFSGGRLQECEMSADQRPSGKLSVVIHWNEIVNVHSPVRYPVNQEMMDKFERFGDVFVCQNHPLGHRHVPGSK